jgi:Xaa-Pro aminopeptidase
VTPELEAKLAVMRGALEANGLAAIRLRGADWFAWATCGGSSVVNVSAEQGVAEVLVTGSEALVLADRIDADRIRGEQTIEGFTVLETPWADPRARDEVVRERVGGDAARVASDRPRGEELTLPAELAAARLRLTPGEIERYRALGRDAARAVSDSLRRARPEMTETELAAETAAALVRGTMTPVVILVGGARRLPIYRHPLPMDEPLGQRAMLVICARRQGLIANLTRFGMFRERTAVERALDAAVADVEAAAWDASTPGATLGSVYRLIVDAYARAGFPGAELDHHQGGLTGYLAREEVATPDSATPIAVGSALAWNPSLPGTKIEDTVVVTSDGLEILTVDPDWPNFRVGGRPRPDVLELG